MFPNLSGFPISSNMWNTDPSTFSVGMQYSIFFHGFGGFSVNGTFQNLDGCASWRTQNNRGTYEVRPYKGCVVINAIFRRLFHTCAWIGRRFAQRLGVTQNRTIQHPPIALVSDPNIPKNDRSCVTPRIRVGHIHTPGQWIFLTRTTYSLNWCRISILACVRSVGDGIPRTPLDACPSYRNFVG